MNLSIWKRLFRTQFGLTLGLCILLQGLLMAIAGPLLPILVSNQIGLNKLQVTDFYLLNTILGVVVVIVTGYLSDGTVARYKLVLVGGITAAVGYAGLAISTQPLHAFIAGPITVMLGILFPQLFAVARAGIVSDWDHQSQVLGITALRTLFSLGYIIGTALGSFFAAVLSIPLIYFIVAVGVLGLTFFAAWTLALVETHIRSIAADSQRDNSAAVRPAETAKSRVGLPLYALVIPLLSVAVLRGADSTRGVYLSLVLYQMFHDVSLGPLMFGITAAELITMGLIGYLSVKIGEKNAMAFGALTGAFYYIVMATTHSLPVLYVVHIIYAIFNAALLGVAMAYVQNMLADRAGMGGSLYLAVLNFGSIMGIVAPLLVDGYDQTIFVIPAIMCIVGALMLYFGDRTAQIEARLEAANKMTTRPDL